MVYYWLLKIGWIEVPKMEAKTIDINYKESHLNSGNNFFELCSD